MIKRLGNRYAFKVTFILPEKRSARRRKKNPFDSSVSVMHGTFIGKSDKRLKDGEIMVRVGVAQGGKEVTSQTRQFTVPTAKNVRE